MLNPYTRVIWVNYNSMKKFTEPALEPLESIVAEDDDRLEVIMADYVSRDGSLEAMVLSIDEMVEEARKLLEKRADKRTLSLHTNSSS